MSVKMNVTVPVGSSGRTRRFSLFTSAKANCPSAARELLRLRAFTVPGQCLKQTQTPFCPPVRPEPKTLPIVRSLALSLEQTAGNANRRNAYDRVDKLGVTGSSPVQLIRKDLLTRVSLPDAWLREASVMLTCGPCRRVVFDATGVRVADPTRRVASCRSHICEARLQSSSLGGLGF
jgi:hypothetical protein